MPISVEILDMLGRPVYSIERLGQIEGTKLNVDISDKPKGVYIIKLLYLNQMYTYKIINQ